MLRLLLMSTGGGERQVIDHSDVDNHSGLQGAFSGAVRDHGAGGGCLRAAGGVLVRRAVGNRANCCSGVRQGCVGTRHVGLGLIRQG